MQPTRVPYEESSVYSDMDPRAPDCALPPPDFDLVLHPGEVLQVPKHWWHFVSAESDDDSELTVSINLWCPEKDDHKDRLKEAVTRFAFGAVLSAVGDVCGGEEDLWTCPSEELRDEDDRVTHGEHIEFVLSALQGLNRDEKNYSKSNVMRKVISAFCSPEVIDLVCSKLENSPNS